MILFRPRWVELVWAALYVSRWWLGPGVTIFLETLLETHFFFFRSCFPAVVVVFVALTHSRMPTFCAGALGGICLGNARREVLVRAHLIKYILCNSMLGTTYSIYSTRYISWCTLRTSLG